MNLKETRATWGSKRPFQRQYQMHRWNAKHRNIDWQFTYDTWIEWWGEDITKRGYGKEKLCMARNGDVGPYSPDNCKKITHSENVIEAQKGRLRSKEHCANLSSSVKESWVKRKTKHEFA